MNTEVATAVPLDMVRLLSALLFATVGVACASSPAAELPALAEPEPRSYTPAPPPAIEARGSLTDTSGSVLPARPCPVAPTDDGACEVTHDVVTDEALVGLSARCDDDNVYNGCASNAVALRWQDHVAATPRLVRIALETSIFCAHPESAPGERLQRIALNGAANVVGAYEADMAACSCAARAQEHVFELEAGSLAEYRAGGENTLAFVGANRCLGLKRNARWNGAVARVTVSY